MRPRFPSTLGYLMAWLTLSAMVLVAAFQVHSLIVIAGYWIVHTPSLRPSGWSSSTVSGVSSMGYLVLGAIALGLITYIEQELRAATGDERLLKRSLRIAAIIVAVWAIVYAVNRLAA